LSALRSLSLTENSVDLSITVSLEKVGNNQFKAIAPIGAPFDIVLPLTILNGSIIGDTTTITISAGSVESDLLNVGRTPNATDPVTVEIGTLPSLPVSHYGYRIVKPITEDDNKLSFAVTVPDYQPTTNTPPVFIEGDSTTRSIPENTLPGVNIGGRISAKDAESDLLTFTLGGTDAASFAIGSGTGQLKTSAPLDYERKTTYSVIVTVSDGHLTNRINVTINVTDVYENNDPVFIDGDMTERSIAENTPAGTNIGSPVYATDLDEEDVLTYTLGGADAASFGIQAATGQILTRTSLDYEMKDTYEVVVFVEDGKGGTDTISVAINVTDVYENNAPVFIEGDSTERSIAENTPAGKNIGSPISATDLDEEDVLTYTLSGTNASSFGIVSTTGQLITRDLLDYEQKNAYVVTVSVSDGNGGTDTIGVAILVTDKDETPTTHAPVFTEGDSTERSIAENTPAGRNIGAAIVATDLDEEDVLTYTLSGTDSTSFAIVSTTGQLKTQAPLDYEQRNTYAVIVIVSDGNGGTDTISVAVNVTDIYENNAPVFTEGDSTERSIAENTPVGTNIGSPISATDLDEEDVLIYTLSGTDALSFSIVSTTGQLKTRNPLDYEQKNTYAVTVFVSDGNGGTDTISVAINVTDLPENNAPVFAEDSTTRYIPENTSVGTDIGEAVSAKDADTDDILTYTLSGTDGALFFITSTTGQLKTSTPLDYETRNSYSVLVTVSDGTFTATIRVTIIITDVDENSGPVFAGNRTTRFVKENTPTGVNIGSAVTATDKDDDTLTYTLGGTDAETFSIIRSTGQLKTREALDFETKNSYTVTVTVSDGRFTAYIAVDITIIDVDETPPPELGSSRISISEIMFGSERRFSPSQWIELNNAGPDIINLSGWKLVIHNRNSEDLTGPVRSIITFKDDFWDDAPRLWPNDVILVVSSSDSQSDNIIDDQVYDLRWRTNLSLGLWTTILSAEGFYIQLFDDEGNLVDEAGNLDRSNLLWNLPYGQNRGKTRAGNRTSMIRRYADSIPLNGTQASGWISAADANLTDDQLTYYGDKDDISTPGIGIVINEISSQYTEHDVNQDNVVDIRDLVIVAARIGQSGPNPADVNGDGTVNIQDLILVAGAIGQTSAAPPLHPVSAANLNAADIQKWLIGAQGLDLTDVKLQNGIHYLEQLLQALIPKQTELLPNFPNPFNPETWIPYQLAGDALVRLTIYDQRGIVIRRFDVGHKTPAVYRSRSSAIYWDGRNEVGDKVASGIYFYTLTAGNYTATRKMLILK